MARILFVVTGASGWTLADGTVHPTGFWAEELLAPYEAFTEAGHEVAFATPGGVTPVADEGSLSGDDADAQRAALAAIEGLQHPAALETVDAAAFDAVFYPGGHGPMEDLAVDATSGRVVVAALDAGTPLGVVCHGVAALLAGTREDGTLAAAGRTVTAFSDDEERQAGLADQAPWLLESRLRENGVQVEVGEPWADKVVVDGALVSGQNPQSSASVARALLDVLGR